MISVRKFVICILYTKVGNPISVPVILPVPFLCHYVTTLQIRPREFLWVEMTSIKNISTNNLHDSVVKHVSTKARDFEIPHSVHRNLLSGRISRVVRYPAASKLSESPLSVDHHNAVLFNDRLASTISCKIQR